MGEFIILAEGSPGDVHLKERVHAGADEKENSIFLAVKRKIVGIVYLTLIFVLFVGFTMKFRPCHTTFV